MAIMSELDASCLDVSHAQEFFDRVVQTSISESLLIDAIELYATQEIFGDEDREKFLEKYISYPYYSLVRKAVLDVVAAVIAADEIESDDIFEKTISLLNAFENDVVISKMKRVMLYKMTRDAADDMSAVKEKRFFSRMKYAEKCFYDQGLVFLSN